MAYQNFQPYQYGYGYPYYQQQANQGRIEQYQQSYNPSAANQPAQQQINQGLLWVQGEAGAKSYLVAPNTTVLLMDSDAQRFYIKSADAAGMPSLKTYEYIEVTNQPPAVVATVREQEPNPEYVTRQEYKELVKKYSEIMDILTDPEGAKKQ